MLLGTENFNEKKSNPSLAWAKPFENTVFTKYKIKSVNSNLKTKEYGLGDLYGK